MSYIAKSRNRKPHTTSSTGHCVVVADIARRMARRQNALFTRRCTLPTDAPEKTGDFGLELTKDNTGEESLGMLHMPAVPSTEGLTGGTVPPRLIDEHLVVIGGLLHDIGTYFLLKQDGSDGRTAQIRRSALCSARAQGLRILAERGR